jgi:hypothetical protein
MRRTVTLVLMIGSVALAAAGTAQADKPSGYTLTATPHTQQVDAGATQFEIDLVGTNNTATDSGFCTINIDVNHGFEINQFPYQVLLAGQTGGITASFWNIELNGFTGIRSLKFDFSLDCGSGTVASASAHVVLRG